MNECITTISSQVAFPFADLLQIQNLNTVSCQNWAATLIMIYKYAEYEYLTKNYFF